MFARTVKFQYPIEQVNKPIVTRIVKDFDVAPNILSANINPSVGGWLILQLLGDETAVNDAIEWTASQGIIVSDIVTESAAEPLV